MASRSSDSCCQILIVVAGTQRSLSLFFLDFLAALRKSRAKSRKLLKLWQEAVFACHLRQEAAGENE